MTEFENEHEAAGFAAFGHLHASKHYAWLPRPIEADIAAGYCLPPVEQNDVKMHQPLPKARQSWLRGYGRAAAEHAARGEASHAAAD